MLGQGIEAFDKITTKVPSVLQDIYKKLTPIKYGAYNTKTNKYINDVDQDDFEYVKLQTPIETMKSGYGTCYEQSILTAYLAKQNNLQYSCAMFANAIGNTHLICCVLYEKAWYWIEHAWGNYRKIHGPFASLTDIDKLVSKLLVDSNKSKITYHQFNFPVEQFFSGNHMYPDIIKVANDL